MHEPASTGHQLKINEALALTSSKDILDTTKRAGPKKILVSLDIRVGSGQLDTNLASNSWLTILKDNKLCSILRLMCVLMRFKILGIHPDNLSMLLGMLKREYRLLQEKINSTLIGFDYGSKIGVSVQESSVGRTRKILYNQVKNEGFNAAGKIFFGILN